HNSWQVDGDASNGAVPVAFKGPPLIPLLDAPHHPLRTDPGTPAQGHRALSARCNAAACGPARLHGSGGCRASGGQPEFGAHRGSPGGPEGPQGRGAGREGSAPGGNGGSPGPTRPPAKRNRSGPDGGESPGSGEQVCRKR